MPRIRWTTELLLDIAKQYPTRKALKEANLKAYNAIMDRKIANIAFAHMELIRTYWTKQMLIDSVVGYTDIETYKKENESAYTTICNRGLNKEIIGHIERKHRIHTEESLAKLARQYQSRSSFSKNERAAYNIALNRKILDKITAHMPRLVKPEWKYGELEKLANLCNTRQEFKTLYPSAHSSAKRRKLLDQLFVGKKKYAIPKTKAEVLEISKKYKTRVDFQKKDGGSYNNALRNGFLEEACAHMAPAQKFRPELPSIFYVLTINSNELGSFIGYGITNDWSDRLRDHRLSLRKEGMSITDMKIFNLESGYIAKKIEDTFKASFPLLAINVRGFKKENFAYDFLDDALMLLKDYSLSLE